MIGQETIRADNVGGWSNPRLTAAYRAIGSGDAESSEGPRGVFSPSVGYGARRSLDGGRASLEKPAQRADDATVLALDLGVILRLLLTSGGVTNASILDALVDLLGKRVSDCHALCIPTARWGHPSAVRSRREDLLLACRRGVA